ncbi:MAG TPA: carboxypeptidase-like regulatory domain-containing protein [Solimonas sp.]|nr:carboxypeptidase-like regulatory domain-containing protein [Solimonas sp.]
MNNRVLTFVVLLIAGATLYQSPAHAVTSSSPVIEEFYVESQDRLEPGAHIAFTVEGTPHATASVRIAGVPRRIPLKETDSGVYEGTYTVRSTDRITTATTARATLRKRSRSTSAMLQDSLGTTVNALASAPSAVLGAVTGSAGSGALAIQNFSVNPPDRIEPGADILFSMDGTPGGQASLSIAGVAGAIPLRETRSGHYEGTYTVRRADRIASNASVVGTLAVDGKTLRSNLNQTLVSSLKPIIGNLTPAQGATVAPGEMTTISGTFSDPSGAGIDPGSVTLLVSGRDVTRSAVITPQYFNYRSELAPGTYTVAVNARDRSGNATREAWNFKVAASAAMAETALPLSITSPASNSVVGSSGVTQVRGHTAPNATVDVKVQAVSALFGMFGYSQNLLTQTLHADPYGNFTFSFQPRSMSKDTRYEVGITASKDGLTKVETLVLTQQQ